MLVYEKGGLIRPVQLRLPFVESGQRVASLKKNVWTSHDVYVDDSGVNIFMTQKYANDSILCIATHC